MRHEEWVASAPEQCGSFHPPLPWVLLDSLNTQIYYISLSLKWITLGVGLVICLRVNMSDNVPWCRAIETSHGFGSHVNCLLPLYSICYILFYFLFVCVDRRALLLHPQFHPLSHTHQGIYPVRYIPRTVHGSQHTSVRALYDGPVLPLDHLM